jgi:hypothetical protein
MVTCWPKHVGFNLRFKTQRTLRSGHLNGFIELILIDCFSVFVKCFYKYMVHELVRWVKIQIRLRWTSFVRGLWLQRAIHWCTDTILQPHVVSFSCRRSPCINAVFERAKIKNTSYHTLFNRIKSGSCVDKGVMFKVRHSSMGNNDFTIIRQIIAEQQLAQQSHAAPRKSLRHLGESCCLQNVTTYTNQHSIMSHTTWLFINEFL